MGMRMNERNKTPNPMTIGPLGCSVYSRYPPTDIQITKMIKRILNNIFMGAKLQKVLSLESNF